MRKRRERDAPERRDRISALRGARVSPAAAEETAFHSVKQLQVWGWARLQDEQRCSVDGEQQTVHRHKAFQRQQIESRLAARRGSVAQLRAAPCVRARGGAGGRAANQREERVRDEEPGERERFRVVRAGAAPAAAPRHAEAADPDGALSPRIRRVRGER